MAVGDRPNFSGDLSLTAPTGGVTRGLIYLIQGVYVVARETASAAAAFAAAVRGPVTVSKVAATGKSFAVGQKVYYVSATKNLTPSATGNVLVGFALSAAAATDTSVDVFMTGLPVTAS